MSSFPNIPLELVPRLVANYSPRKGPLFRKPLVEKMPMWSVDAKGGPTSSNINYLTARALLAHAQIEDWRVEPEVFNAIELHIDAARAKGIDVSDLRDLKVEVYSEEISEDL